MEVGVVHSSVCFVYLHICEVVKRIRTRLARIGCKYLSFSIPSETF